MSLKPGNGPRAEHILPDLLRPGLSLVLCGSAAGSASARAGAYYAGPGNRFWDILAETDLTPIRLAPEEFGTLLQYGIGLTDIAKTAFGSDHELPTTADAPGELAEKIARYTPRILGFNGKRAAARFLDRRTSQVAYGPLTESYRATALFVLPSTSAAARKYWDPAPWHSLAAAVRKLSQNPATNRAG